MEMQLEKNHAASFILMQLEFEKIAFFFSTTLVCSYLHILGQIPLQLWPGCWL